MKPNGRIYKIIKYALFLITLVAPPVTFTSCQDFGYPPSPTPQLATPAQPVTGNTVITTRDAALLAVYQHLLSLAETPGAKTYLADFYTACDNWSAESEFFKDGSGTWYVVADMTGNKDWKWKPYWQQAAWLVYRDGKVIPSTRFLANALRIEADLQALSPGLEPASGEKS